MKPILLTILLLLSACHHFRTVSLSESQQRNFPSLFHRGPFTPPEKPANPIRVRARIVEVMTYKGGTRSWDTWPHHHLKLEIIEGKLPSHPSTSRFEYHTNSRHPSLAHQFTIGQILTFLYDEEGKLWGIEEIKPKYPHFIERANLNPQLSQRLSSFIRTSTYTFRRYVYDRRTQANTRDSLPNVRLKQTQAHGLADTHGAL